jgi:hypothetical protein
MQRLRFILLSLTAALAVGAVAAATAQASASVQGPFWKVAGARLTGEETIVVEANGSQELKTSKQIVVCSKVKVKSGSAIIGVAGENSNKSKEVIEYSGCEVKGDGSPCSVTEPIVTNNVVNKTGYSSKKSSTEGSGKLLTAFEPESGNVFVELKFSGTGCEVTATKVERKAATEVRLVAEDINSKGEVVEVTKGQTEGKAGEINFPATAITKVFVEEAGKLKEVKAGLKAFGLASSLIAKDKISLTSMNEWVVAT